MMLRFFQNFFGCCWGRMPDQQRKQTSHHDGIESLQGFEHKRENYCCFAMLNTCGDRGSSTLVFSNCPHMLLRNFPRIFFWRFQIYLCRDAENARETAACKDSGWRQRIEYSTLQKEHMPQKNAYEDVFVLATRRSLHEKQGTCHVQGLVARYWPQRQRLLFTPCTHANFRLLFLAILFSMRPVLSISNSLFLFPSLQQAEAIIYFLHDS